MAVRDDLTVDQYTDPRIVTIARPSTTITIQDLHDTLVAIQETPAGMQFPNLVESEGKGGGVTGVVAILQNLEVLFAPRTDKLQSGTVTTTNAPGECLIDTAATFITNLVSRGDMAVNVTDGSHATVLDVVSETELNTLPLAGGVDNRWDVTDAYEIFDYELCSITSGDLFAVDSLGAPIAAILNSFGVFGPIIEQSTSPAAAPVQPTTILQGTTTWEQAVAQMLNLMEGDEEVRAATYRRLHKITKAELLAKDKTGILPNIDLIEQP